MWELNHKLEQPTDPEKNVPFSISSSISKNAPVISTAVMLDIAYRSLGIVYGDLGTSPLYVFHSTFPDGVSDTEDLVGAVSLIIYTLALIPLIKYVFIVLRANDNGEGGTFALYSLICRHIKVHIIANQHHTDFQLTTYVREPLKKGFWASRLATKIEKSDTLQTLLLLLVLLGACMAVGDGILTPAISVLSSVNGIKVSHPTLSSNVVVILALVILVAVFCLQYIGTEKVAFLFAPVVLVWLLSIGSIGIYNIVKHNPSILRALSPLYILRYFKRDAQFAWSSLGGIVLSITGTEVMFADLGHFSVQSIQVAFTMLVFPCLLAAYLGQAAFLTQNPHRVSEAFYRSIPGPIHWPIFIIATLAAVVASQASISATFLIIKQAVALGCFPRVKLIHTSRKFLGQIYIPEINWILMVLCLVITGGFKNISQIGNAYGIAVMGVMLVTTVLMAIIMLIVWQSNSIFLFSFLAIFGTMELVYFSSVLFKIDNGGWVPLAIASTLLTIMYVWHYGSMKRHMYERESRVSMEWILGLGPSLGLVRVPGIGLFYTELAHGVSCIFSHFITHFPAIHDILVFVCVKYLPVTTVPPEERFLIRRIGPKHLCMFRCVARYGYIDLHKRDDKFESKFLESLENFIRLEAATESKDHITNTAITYPSPSEGSHDFTDNPFLTPLPSLAGQALLPQSTQSAVEEQEEDLHDSLSFPYAGPASSQFSIMLGSPPHGFQHYAFPSHAAGSHSSEIMAAATSESSTAADELNLKADVDSQRYEGSPIIRQRSENNWINSKRYGESASKRQRLENNLICRSPQLLGEAEEGFGRDVGGVEEQLEFLKKAKEVGLVHILGNTVVRSRKDANLVKKSVVNYGYAFLERVCRDSSETLNIPHESLLNVGMIYYV